MKEPDPDKVVKRLWTLRERLSSPLSSIPYEVTGAVWSPECQSCGHARHHRKEGVERCSRCGSPWVELEGRVAKSSNKHRPRTNHRQLMADEFSYCVSVLNHVPEPSRSLYEEHLSPLGGGMVYAVRVARDRGLCGNLSPHAYWTHIRAAREIVGLRLSFMGGVTATRGAA